jgi:purine nucleosidase
MRKLFFLNVVLSFVVGFLGYAPTLHADATAPVKIIFDTDMCGDFDDVGALAVLNALADQGKDEILACVANGHDKDKATAASISAINTYYGRPNIPIGTYQGPGYPPYPSHYTAKLRDEFPQSAKPDDQEPTSLDIYRRTLAAAPNHSVVIVSTGLLINLRNLLESKPDASSPLSGIDLVKLKVKKLVVMGGQYPQGSESNFISTGAGPDTQYAVEHWPTPILFSGFEIGLPMITGKVLVHTPVTNPVRRAYDPNGRPSWDLTAALAAVEDPTLYWTVSPEGYCEVRSNGSDQWHETPNRHHTYLIAKMPPAEVGKVLDDLLALPPALKK